MKLNDVAMLAIIFFAAISPRHSYRFTAGNRKRGCDAGGCGHFHASRGNRLHLGVDFLAYAGEEIFAPVSGVVARIGNVYQDEQYKLIELRGSGANKVFKIMYVSPFVVAGDRVKRGDLIGWAQNIREKFPDVQNHIHVELFINGMNRSSEL